MCACTALIAKAADDVVMMLAVMREYLESGRKAPM
jgi:hypothetical protein